MDNVSVYVVVAVVVHSSPLSSVVVELEKISHRIWIIPQVVSCQLFRAGNWNKCSMKCGATPQSEQTSVTPAVMRAL